MTAAISKKLKIRKDMQKFVFDPRVHMNLNKIDRYNLDQLDRYGEY